MATLGGPAQVVSVQTGGQQQGGAAIPVAVVTDGRGVVGGPAIPVYVVTSGPVQGGPALPVVAAATGRTVQGGAAIPVYVVSGSLGGGGSAPANTVLPVVSGTTELGATLTTTNGTWTNSPTSYSYQWYRNGVAIGGATNSTYVLVSADMGTTITVIVTATNASGSTAATSAGTTIPNWLLLDRFTTNEAAPIATPRTCEPGPGTLTVVQTNGNFDITASLLECPLPVPTGTWQNKGWYHTAGVARACGRAHVIAYKQNAGNNSGVGYYASAALQAGFLAQMGIHSAGFIYENGVLAGGVSTVFPLVNGTQYSIAIVPRTTGCWLMINDGAWQLIWVGHLNTSANLFAFFESSAASVTLDNARVVDFGSPWDSDYGIATDRKAISAANDTITTTADCIVEHTFTAQTGVTKNILFRYLDDNNCWIARFDQTASRLFLYEKVLGVETERGAAGGVAFTQTNGTSYRAMITATDTTIRVYAAAASAVPGAIKIEYAAAVFQQTQTGAKVDNAGTNFIGWPRNPTVPNL